MPEDRSLDEFAVDAGESDSSAASEPSESPERDRESDGTEPGDAIDSGLDETVEVDPIESTYAASAGGGECAACGEVVAERWRDDGELVCPDCKSW